MHTGAQSLTDKKIDANYLIILRIDHMLIDFQYLSLKKMLPRLICLFASFSSAARHADSHVSLTRGFLMSLPLQCYPRISQGGGRGVDRFLPRLPAHCSPAHPALLNHLPPGPGAPSTASHRAHGAVQASGGAATPRRGLGRLRSLPPKEPGPHHGQRCLGRGTPPSPTGTQ